MAVFVGEMMRFPGADQSAGKSTVNLALAAFSVLYVGGLIGFFIQLRLLSGSDGAIVGLAPLLSLVLVVKVSDTGQYFVGTRYGTRKLAPLLSPGKTWEGAVGGIGASALVTATLLTLWFGSLAGLSGWGRALVYCLVLGAVGLVGDLAESLLKRDAEMKDSSTWLPGLGGVLDVLDSLLVAGPVAYLCWVWGLVGP
jgi:phosphatidate cytidylyltransferase